MRARQVQRRGGAITRKFMPAAICRPAGTWIGITSLTDVFAAVTNIAAPSEKRSDAAIRGALWPII